MSIKIHVPEYMHPATRNKDVIEVDGSTVGECLGHLVRRFPNIEDQLFDMNGRLPIYLDIWVNGESSYPEELAKQVVDRDELYILVMG